MHTQTKKERNTKNKTEKKIECKKRKKKKDRKKEQNKMKTQFRWRLYCLFLTYKYVNVQWNQMFIKMELFSFSKMLICKITTYIRHTHKPSANSIYSIHNTHTYIIYNKCSTSSKYQNGIENLLILVT